MTLPNEVREAMARAMCSQGGFDPDERMANDGPRWRCYLPGVDAALSALEAAGWTPVKLETVVDAAYAKGRADALEEAAQMAEIDARAISKGTHGRMGSTTAIGDHIAQAIRAIASIESAALLTASNPKEKPDV